MLLSIWSKSLVTLLAHWRIRSVAFWQWWLLYLYSLTNRVLLFHSTHCVYVCMRVCVRVDEQGPHARRLQFLYLAMYLSRYIYLKFSVRHHKREFLFTCIIMGCQVGNLRAAGMCDTKQYLDRKVYFVDLSSLFLYCNVFVLLIVPKLKSTGSSQVKTVRPVRYEMVDHKSWF